MEFNHEADSPLYAEEKFAEALDALIWAPGDVRRRLQTALTFLIRLRGKSAPFPAGTDAQARYDRFISRLTSTPANAEGEWTIAASVRGLDHIELASVVSEFLELFRELVIQNADPD